MLRGFTVLLLLLCAGEAASHALHLPVPGAVVGMALALGLLIWRPRLAGVVEGAADLLIRHLSLLFVPAGVGVVAIASGLSGEWPAIIVTLLVSATLAMLVTAGCTVATARWLARRAPDAAADTPTAAAASTKVTPSPQPSAADTPSTVSAPVANRPASKGADAAPTDKAHRQ
ncbi:CidA/LrgA family protein [Chitinasiproducens palmae]|uniref:Holin-like protein n=1 Tax=Chitinasiproducens palmae TaxID=1770053 RepID=A0A1H2PRH9_9BURK|nr:CidA/LrgA family protein [Chitinasiproducens palmae]SDV49475.1 holin-like protein [Chitinasiproducens palmae]